MDRPTSNNADEWAAFLEHWDGSRSYIAVQIAEAIDEAEQQACERAIDRMGWKEIDAFHAELKRGQDMREDAGGYMLRCIRRLFGLSGPATVTTYQDAARVMCKESIHANQGVSHEG